MKGNKERVLMTVSGCSFFFVFFVFFCFFFVFFGGRQKSKSGNASGSSSPVSFSAGVSPMKPLLSPTVSAAPSGTISVGLGVQSIISSKFSRRLGWRGQQRGG